jgi:glycosyltransferase involved in cell wall biosynthesis
MVPEGMRNDLCGAGVRAIIMIYADQRWIGKGGIGRFARHVLASVDYHPVSIPSDPASPFDTWRLARGLGKITRNDLFFSPGYSSPIFCEAPFILTIHDLNHIDRQENSNYAKRIYYATVLRRACRRSVRVLTVSEFSRQRIVDWSGIPPEKVVNVGNGVDPSFNPHVAPYGLPFPYLLCVSNRKRHKNEFRTVEAFARSGVANWVRLVFTGDPTPELDACIRLHEVARRVHFVGRIEEARLSSLYRGAEALVFMSLYEGFGLPVLEAMACGVPVTSANTTALLEVAGDAALLVDPTSVEQMADAVARIVSDMSLRERLRERGLARAGRFSWKVTTGMVNEVLNSEEMLGAA